MRAGGCSVQQALTPEAANVVKQAVTLARRRGHAQVTPLHVANTMLATSTCLFRNACLQSPNHPFQSRALELCFNVALNRLQNPTSGHMMGAHITYNPSISNALVAAFKRAQAHQRRGSIENQQQPLLSVKIELEQLIISILDDPSVSRVMREAGFSSRQVKSNVEQAISAMESSSQRKHSQSPSVSEAGSKASKPRISDSVRDEDIMCVIDNLVSMKKRSTVVVGESVASTEDVIQRVKEKIENGEDIHEVLKNVKFLSLSLTSFKHHTRVEIDQKIEEIKSLCCMGNGVILFLGDLKLVAEYRSSTTTSSSMQGRSYYCPVEHLIDELGKLVSATGESRKFWLMGIATFQDYMRFKSNGDSSLETVLGLHAITIPSGCSLGLSLVTDSEFQSEMSINKAESGASWILHQGEQGTQVNCCAECSAKFWTEAKKIQTNTCNNDSTSSSLPAWLKQYKDQSRRQNDSDQDYASVKDLCKKWNSYCNSVHRNSYSSERTLSFSPISPSSSTSAFSHEQQCHEFWPSQAANYRTPEEPGFNIGITPPHDGLKRPFFPNPSSTPNSASSNDIAMDTDHQYIQNFKEMNVENSKFLSDALEKIVPWQKDIIPEIVSTILRCRSRLARRKGMSRNSEVKEETWLFFQGVDVEAKEKIAKELAKLIFCSQENFISIPLSSFSSTKECKNKRSRDEHSESYFDRFSEAVSSNPHRVFFLEDIDQADYTSQMGFKRAMEIGQLTNLNGVEICLKDAVIILSCDNFSSRSRACSPTSKQKVLDSCEGSGAMEETSPCVSLDLNISIDEDMIDEDEQAMDNIGLLEYVDRMVVFKIQESH